MVGASVRDNVGNKVGIEVFSIVGVGVTGTFVIGTDAADLYSQKSSMVTATFEIDFGFCFRTNREQV
jgi:hypothetical protein